MEKVAWICAYVPEEIIAAAGFQPVRLWPGETQCQGNCHMLPSNFCPYVKQLAEGFEKDEYSHIRGIVIANSCNAATHLFNVLTQLSSENQFVYLLDLPRKQEHTAYQYYAYQIKHLYDYLKSQAKVDCRIDEEKTSMDDIRILTNTLKIYQETQKLLLSINYQLHLVCNNILHFIQSLSTEPRKQVNKELGNRISSLESHYKQENNNPVIMLSGGIVTREMYQVICESSPYPVIPENCAGFRYLYKPQLLKIPLDTNYYRSDALQIFQLIAKAYMEKPSCMRTFGSSTQHTSREKALKEFFARYNVQGIIHHDLGFCDLANYDYLISSKLYDKLGYPYLRINSELGSSELNQIRTRVEAFFETILL